MPPPVETEQTPARPSWPHTSTRASVPFSYRRHHFFGACRDMASLLSPSPTFTPAAQPRADLPSSLTLQLSSSPQCPTKPSPSVQPGAPTRGNSAGIMSECLAQPLSLQAVTGSWRPHGAGLCYLHRTRGFRAPPRCQPAQAQSMWTGLGRALPSRAQHLTLSLVQASCEKTHSHSPTLKHVPVNKGSAATHAVGRPAPLVTSSRPWARPIFSECPPPSNELSSFYPTGLGWAP